MPVPAAGHANVIARYPHPLEVGRPSQHLIEQLAVAGLDVGALPVGIAGLADSRRELVANPLQLPQPDHPWLVSRRSDAELQFQARKGVDEEACQLMLEPSYLPPQLGSGEALVASYPKCCEVVSFKQIRHRSFECRSPHGVGESDAG